MTEELLSDVTSEPTDVSSSGETSEETSSFFEEQELDLLGDNTEESALSEQEGGEEEAPEEPTAESTEDQTITIDGQEYKLSDVEAAIEVRNNQAEWNRINTQKAQEIAEERRLLDEERAKLEQYQKPEAEDQSNMTEEEKQTAQWLKERGFIHKDEVERMLEERLNPLQQTTEEMQLAQASQTIAEELDALVDSGKIQPEQKAELVQYSIENNVQHLPFEDVWLLANKENFSEMKREEGIEQARIDAERKQRQKSVMSTKGAQARAGGSRYNPEKHRGMSTTDFLMDQYL